MFTLIFFLMIAGLTISYHVGTRTCLFVHNVSNFHLVIWADGLSHKIVRSVLKIIIEDAQDLASWRF